MLFEADSQLLTRFSNLKSRLSTLEMRAGMTTLLYHPKISPIWRGKILTRIARTPQPQLSLIRTPSSVAYRKTRTGIILRWKCNPFRLQPISDSKLAYFACTLRTRALTRARKLANGRLCYGFSRRGVSKYRPCPSRNTSGISSEARPLEKWAASVAPGPLRATRRALEGV
jgi:hypothetical protein